METALEKYLDNPEATNRKKKMHNVQTQTFLGDASLVSTTFWPAFMWFYVGVSTQVKSILDICVCIL